MICHFSHLTKISPVPHRTTTPKTPSRSANLSNHQHAPPVSCDHHRRLTVADKTRPAGRKRTRREREAVEQQPRRRDPPPPPAVTVWTHLHEHTRPIWPGQAQGLVKLMSTRCSIRAIVTAIASSRRTFRPPKVAQTSRGQACPSPDGAQKGLDLSREGAATSVRTTPQPRCRAVTAKPPGAPPS
jgi:hypothetical protein